jgi:hypothetical protein
MLLKENDYVAMENPIKENRLHCNLAEEQKLNKGGKKPSLSSAKGLCHSYWARPKTFAKIQTPAYVHDANASLRGPNSVLCLLYKAHLNISPYQIAWLLLGE